MPAVAFSSLMASRDFLQSEAAKAFTRAFRRARLWVMEAPATEIAAKESVLFPNVGFDALSASIARYQQLGCWQGDIAITRELYDHATNVFLHSAGISTRHAYDEVVVPPPA